LCAALSWKKKPYVAQLVQFAAFKFFLIFVPITSFEARAANALREPALLRRKLREVKKFAHPSQKFIERERVLTCVAKCTVL